MIAEDSGVQKTSSSFRIAKRMEIPWRPANRSPKITGFFAPGMVTCPMHIMHGVCPISRLCRPEPSDHSENAPGNVVISMSWCLPMVLIALSTCWPNWMLVRDTSIPILLAPVGLESDVFSIHQLLMTHTSTDPLLPPLPGPIPCKTHLGNTGKNHLLCPFSPSTMPYKAWVEFNFQIRAQ